MGKGARTFYPSREEKYVPRVNRIGDTFRNCMAYSKCSYCYSKTNWNNLFGRWGRVVNLPDLSVTVLQWQ